MALSSTREAVPDSVALRGPALAVCWSGCIDCTTSFGKEYENGQARASGVLARGWEELLARIRRTEREFVLGFNMKIVVGGKGSLKQEARQGASLDEQQME